MKDRRQQLLEKKKRLEQQLKELDERESGRKQNDDLKRAQLAGKAMLKHAKIDPQFAATRQFPRAKLVRAVCHG